MKENRGENMANEAAIGFMDSGVGGLTVVKEAMRQLPNERIIYLGDTERCPYGPRPNEQVLEFTWQMTSFLLNKKIKMLVIACNTATAVALEKIKKSLDIPVVGVIMPGSRAALKATRNNRIGVIGTEVTINSKAYATAIKKKSPQTNVIQKACPKFVPIVESHKASSSIAKMIVAEALNGLKKQQLDTLILGCTHYPLLKPIIQHVMGNKVTLIDSGAETISEVSMLLDYFDIAASAKKEADRGHEFYMTGSQNLFNNITKEWLDLKEINSKKIRLKK